MPSCIAIGNKIGAMISKIAEGSMKLPAISSRMLTTIRKDHGSSPAATIISVM